MRQNRFGWLAAGILAALVGTGSVHAAAPPGNVVAAATRGGPLDPVAALTSRDGKFIRLSQVPAGCFSGAPILSSPTAHEFTIVVRIEDRSSATEFLNDPLTRWFRSPFPPPQAVSRQYLNYIDREQETSAVLETLQKKLLELHDKGCFEVELSPKGDNRTEMRIRYDPIFAPDAGWKVEHSGNGEGFDFGVSLAF